MLHEEYPEAVLVSEWNGPKMALKNGFDMDFMLNEAGNGYDWLLRAYDGEMDSNPRNIGKAYFCKDSGTGIDKFLDDWLPSYKATHKDGLYCLITCNHDTVRPSAGLTTEELRLAYAMIFTMPGAPFLYYGDEIGMRYQKLPTKEGGYFRTGSRTPMQWAPGKIWDSRMPRRRPSICRWIRRLMRPQWPTSRRIPKACGIRCRICWPSATGTGIWIPTHRSRSCLPPRQRGVPTLCLAPRLADLRRQPGRGSGGTVS